MARRTIWNDTWYPIFLTFVALTLSVLSLKAMPMPFVWIGLVWAFALFAAIVCLRRPWSPALVFLLFNGGVIAAAFAAAEAYLLIHEAESPESPRYSSEYPVKDDVLGSAPVRGVKVRATKFERGVIVYDVTYTIDSTGLRVASPVKNGKPAGCILFFGDSFTFGEGLQDTETLPYQVGLQSGGQYQTFNFGFHGYGPHQMLAEIQKGLVNQIVDCQPDYAIYQALPHHVARVAGKVSFGKHAPRYQLDPDGTVSFGGHFDDEKEISSLLGDELRWQLGKSAIYRMLERQDRDVSEEDIRLLLSIVRRSNDLLAVDYPGIKFHVILWDRGGKNENTIYRKLQDGFSQMNIPIHLVEDILPGYTLDSSKYWLSTSDKHPNALADRILASYVLAKIVSNGSGPTASAN
jgi:hypothetical protein